MGKAFYVWTACAYVAETSFILNALVTNFSPFALVLHYIVLVCTMYSGWTMGRRSV